MNTAIFRDRADLILYADADADPPLTGQQRPGGGGGGGCVFSHTCPIWGGAVV